jgi:thioredoxin reductase (NADPH)
MEDVFDLIIIGGGPAGISAAIYANRAMLKFLWIERAFPGGQIAETHEVDNYPGIFDVTGMELSDRLYEHARHLGAEVQTEEVVGLELDGPVKQVITTNQVFLTKTMILATGAEAKHLGINGEERFIGMGVSYCAVCDGAFYRGKTVAVIGGGDVAAKDTIYLSRICKKIYLIHRRHEFRAVKSLQDHVFKLTNVEIVWDSVPLEISGDETVKAVLVENKLTGAQSSIAVDGIFMAVGSKPNNSLVIDKLDLDSKGWIITDEDCETSVKGVFAAGDVRSKSLKQVVTSVADGAIAVSACEKYL